jgi:eukaryotic-like serine/threonine-protein kinase
MGSPTTEKIAERAFDIGLLDERQLQEAWASFGSRNVSIDDFLQFLLRREFLTNYQVERLVKGERSGFFYGPYKILYLVGTGTFARVYRAVNPQTQQVVAVKVLRKRFSDNPVHAGQFLREGRLGCTLRHPNIVPIYDALSEGRSYFMVMEFVEGRNLREFLKIRKKLVPAEATRLITDIADGLRYAAGHGLTHRDLKMTNVLISSTGRAKLVDFGLAAIDENISELGGDLPGNARTIDYAALERATGVRKDDMRSDIYFLGCMYYHMLTGVAPLLETRDRVQRLSKTRFLEVVPAKTREPSLPDSVALVVNKAMMLDPNMRYASPAAIVADLRVAARRLAGEGAKEGAKVLATEVMPEQLHSVMVVESDARMQDIFRKGFRRAGYRMLLTVDPERAISRLHQDDTQVDCIVLNAQSLGLSALEAFNRLAGDKRTEAIPTVLLLDEEQQAWRKKAKTNDNRVILRMPITMKQLRETLAKIVAPNARA